MSSGKEEHKGLALVGSIVLQIPVRVKNVCLYLYIFVLYIQIIAFPDSLLLRLSPKHSLINVDTLLRLSIFQYILLSGLCFHQLQFPLQSNYISSL